MHKISREYQKKTGKTWTTEIKSENVARTNEMLLQDMIAKHYWKARYVASIKRHQNYDGTCTYTVTYDQNGSRDTRNVYTIREN